MLYLWSFSVDSYSSVFFEIIVFLVMVRLPFLKSRTMEILMYRVLVIASHCPLQPVILHVVIDKDCDLGHVVINRSLTAICLKFSTPNPLWISVEFSFSFVHHFCVYAFISYSFNPALGAAKDFYLTDSF